MQISNENVQFGKTVSVPPRKRGIIHKTLNVLGYVIAAIFVFSIFASYHERNDIRSSNSGADQDQSSQHLQQNGVLTPEQAHDLQIMSSATAELRICIRSAAPLAYASGVYGNAQFKTFIRKRCYGNFVDRPFEGEVKDPELLNVMYNLIVDQESAAITQK
jgi:hypothetical protein